LKLSDIGVTQNDSKRWQREAAVPFTDSVAAPGDRPLLRGEVGDLPGVALAQGDRRCTGLSAGGGSDAADVAGTAGRACELRTAAACERAVARTPSGFFS
jgi:hypothetical protein